MSFALNRIQNRARPQFSRCFALLLVVLCVRSGMACASPVSAEVLAKELVRYRTLHSLTASFRQTKKLKGMNLELKSSGEFRLTRDDAGSVIEWLVTEPAYLKLRLTPTSLEMFEAAGAKPKPVVENQDAQTRILRPLYAWLSMDAARIAEHYGIDDKGKGEFELSPKDKDSPVRSLRLRLDARKLVSRVTLEESSGDELRIDFSGTRENP